MTPLQKFIKRLFDLIISTLGIVVLFAPFVFIAILIKLTSRGPVFFTQKRVGQSGDFFLCIKFRTMRIGSEKGSTITTANDSRVTQVGRILRNFKLDELPQLWNVFIGKMSFVGPRPDVPGYADKLQGDSRRILLLRPGITGPASLCFRNEEQLLAAVADPKTYNDSVIWPRKVALNLKYLGEWSLVKDIEYILVTILPFLNNLLRIVPEVKIKTQNG